MSQSIDVGALINAVIYIVPLAALIVSVITFTNASKERHAKTASEAAELKAEIHMLTVQVEELKASYTDADTHYHNNVGRIIKLEEKVYALQGKMAKLEEEIRHAN